MSRQWRDDEVNLDLLNPNERDRYGVEHRYCTNGCGGKLVRRRKRDEQPNWCPRCRVEARVYEKDEG